MLTKQLTIAIHKLSPRPNDVLLVTIPDMDADARRETEDAITAALKTCGVIAVAITEGQSATLVRDGNFVQADDFAHVTIGVT